MPLPESFANEATTTLNGAVTAGAASVVVASATGFPRPPFRVRVSGSLTAGGSGTEYMTVTDDNAAGTTWTVSRGGEAPFGTGLGFATGAAVKHVVTTVGLFEMASFVNVRNPRFAGGAKADHRQSATGNMSAASTTLTDATNGKFRSTDVGKIMIVNGVNTGAGILTTTIAAYTSATQVTLANPAVVAGTNVTYQYATDDGPAINAALTYAATLGTSSAGTGSSTNGLTGSTVYLPPGVYLHSTSIAVPSRVRLLGASREASTIRRTADVPSLTVYGTGTADANRNWYSAVEHLTVDGNDKWMQGVDVVYASQFNMTNVFIYNVHHIGLDLVEVWDSAFTNVFLQFCGGIATTEQPSVYVRSTRAASGFGFSSDTINEIKFTNLHTEHFRAGAIKIGPGFGAATNGPNGIYFNNVKCETAFQSGTVPVFELAPNTERIHIKNVYSHIAAFLDGAAVPLIQNNSIGQTTIRDIQATNAGVATLTSAVNVNISGAGMAVLDGIYGQYGTAPTVATVNVVAAGDMEISNVRANLGTRISGYEIDAAERMLVITADVTTTNTTAANLASMTFTNVPAGTYRVEMRGMHRSSITTGGLAFGVGGTATATGAGTLWYNSSATVVTGVEMTAKDTTFRGANATAAATSYPVMLSFVIVVTGAGTVGLRWNMSAAGTGTLRSGTSVVLTRIR